jgi:hypothetical protein
MSDKAESQETPLGDRMNVQSDAVKLGVPTCQVNRVYENGAIPNWQVLGNDFIEKLRKRRI